MTRNAAIIITAIVLSACCTEQENEVAQQKVRIEALEAEIEKIKGPAADFAELQAQLEETRAKFDDQEALIKEMKDREAQAEERLSMLKGMLSRFKGMIETGKLEVRVADGKMKLELPSAVLFPVGSAELSEKGMETLDEVAEVLKGIKGREFQVAGHTDNQNIGPDNPFESNWHLSTARAVAVVTYLQEKGVRPRSLSAAGYSEYQPIVPNKNKANKAKNRRIEITLMPNLDELPDLSSLKAELGIEEPQAEEGEERTEEEKKE